MEEQSAPLGGTTINFSSTIKSIEKALGDENKSDDERFQNAILSWMGSMPDFMKAIEKKQTLENYSLAGKTISDISSGLTNLEKDLKDKNKSDIEKYIISGLSLSDMIKFMKK